MIARSGALAEPEPEGMIKTELDGDEAPVWPGAAVVVPSALGSEPEESPFGAEGTPDGGRGLLTYRPSVGS